MKLRNRKPSSEKTPGWTKGLLRLTHCGQTFLTPLTQRKVVVHLIIVGWMWSVQHFWRRIRYIQDSLLLLSDLSFGCIADLPSSTLPFFKNLARVQELAEPVVLASMLLRKRCIAVTSKWQVVFWNTCAFFRLDNKKWQLFGIFDMEVPPVLIWPLLTFIASCYRSVQKLYMTDQRGVEDCQM